MHSKKLLTITLITTLLLTACGSDEDGEKTETTAPDEKLYESTDFTITYPRDWEVLEPQSFTSTVPNQTVLAFRNNIQNEIFTANLNISLTNLDEEINSTDFSISTLSKIKKSLLSYAEMPQENITINGIETAIIEFEGKKSASEPIIHFRSFSVIDKQIAYTVMGAYLPNEDESVVNHIDKMLNSFSLK